MKRTILVIVCAGVLTTLLVAALYPFNPHPQNQVTWLVGTKGVHFGQHGTILSSGPLKPPAWISDQFCTLELWLRPSTLDSSTVLAFYNAEDPMQFGIRQMGRDLLVSRDISDGHYKFVKRGIVLNDVFAPLKPVFITVTSDSGATAIYVDGIIKQKASNLSLTDRDLAAQLLVVGNSPVADDGWSGQLLGLAIYDRELAPDQITKHFGSWTKRGRPDGADDEKPVAIYLFNEHQGSIVHNLISSGPDLYAPSYYFVPYKPFLERPWKEFRSDWGYLEDLVVNIGGFIPFGFFFCAYLSSVRWIKKPKFATIFLGGAISLTIEVLQAYLPTRSSGVTDIITNTLGSAAGVFLYSWEITQTLLCRLGLAFITEIRP